MSRWHKFRTCANCCYLSEADTSTGFGCYQDKREVVEVWEDRPACSKWEKDVPPNYEPVNQWSDVWDDPSTRTR